MKDNKDVPNQGIIIESIQQRTKILTWIIFLIVCVLFFINTRVLFAILNYIPSLSIAILLAIVSILVVSGFYIVRKTSFNAINTLVDYSNALKKASDDWRITFDSTKDMLLLLDEKYNIIKVNRATILFLDCSFDEILGRNYADIFSAIDYSDNQSPIEFMRENKTHVTKEGFLSSKDIWLTVSVNPILDNHENMSGSVLLLKDVTESKRAEDKINLLAYYDSLTGLPNRTFYKEFMVRALALADRHNRILATLFLDLDFFKRINDTLGHTAGDQLLIDVGERLKKTLRKSDSIARLSENDVADTVVRLGGDEFIILLNEIIHVHDAAKIARRIVKELSQPFILSGREIVITTSIGISIYPSDGTDVDSLLKHADIAMYQAKKQGRNNYQYYEKSMNADALQKLSLEGNLRNALQKGEFLLHYQPILDAQSRNIRGVEALLRWASPEMGSVAPAEFIPLAEETGLIVPIGDWVLRTACLQTKEWKRGGFESLNISVNLSLRQFENPALLKTISAALRDAELSPENLELEITESTVMDNPEKAVAIMREIRNMGVLISVDDFGTGYSSLNYLRQLPLNALKIDRSFISNALASSSDASIISAIIILAHKLHLKVIAEGVETEDEFNFLCSEECDEVQGYLFSRPLPEDEFARYLKGIKEF